MIDKPICRVCGVELDDGNWYKSSKRIKEYICKECSCKRTDLWRKTNPEKVKSNNTRLHRKSGAISMSENKECSSFLGVFVAERVLSHVFRDVEVMPYGNKGFDFICNNGKKIDVKSACIRRSSSGTLRWAFSIKRNKIADYFLCLAFDSREDLNPLHAWLLPGEKLNRFIGTSIHPSTINKWDDYKLDINKVVSCCNSMKEDK